MYTNVDVCTHLKAFILPDQKAIELESPIRATMATYAIRQLTEQLLLLLLLSWGCSSYSCLSYSCMIERVRGERVRGIKYILEERLLSCAH